MNYLSHYYIDRTNPSPYFKLGLILPDIYRGFNADLRKPVLNSGIVWNSEQQQLVDGVKRHYAIDAAFHNLPEFKKWMDELEQLMKAAPLNGSYIRRYFLAHIWVEWVIDRLLVKHYPDVAVQFYVDMGAVNQNPVMALFNRVGKGKEGSDFFSNFKSLTTNKYLLRYPNNEMFTGALLNLYQRTVKTDVPNEDFALLTGITLQMEQLLEGELDSLFNKLNATNQSL